jgi:hypothetical protein
MTAATSAGPMSEDEPDKAIQSFRHKVVRPVESSPSKRTTRDICTRRIASSRGTRWRQAGYYALSHIRQRDGGDTQGQQDGTTAVVYDDQITRRTLRSRRATALLKRRASIQSGGLQGTLRGVTVTSPAHRHKERLEGNLMQRKMMRKSPPVEKEGLH